MSEAFDIYTLLFLVLAVVIFLRLRNVLGRRTGNERPPYDPYTTQDAKRSGAPDANGDEQQQTEQAAEAEAGDAERGRQLLHVGIDPVAGVSAHGGADHRERSDQPPAAPSTRLPLLLFGAAHRCASITARARLAVACAA